MYITYNYSYATYVLLIVSSDILLSDEAKFVYQSWHICTI